MGSFDNLKNLFVESDSFEENLAQGKALATSGENENDSSVPKGSRANQNTNKDETRKKLVKYFRYACNGQKYYKRVGATDSADFESKFIDLLYKL